MAKVEHDADMTELEKDAKEQKKEHGHGHGHSHDHADGEEHAKIVGLGTVKTAGGATFMIDREGQVEAGRTIEFGVELIGATAAVPTSAWLVNAAGEQICDPVAGEGHDQHWHFNCEPLMPCKGATFVLKVGEEELTIDALAAPNRYEKGPSPCNEGIMTVLKAAGEPTWKAFLELKLHGDAGDLELFLYAKAPVNAKATPFDIPAATVVTITFPSHENKAVELKVRNMEGNEDEAGTPMMRCGVTNYFIFPGESGQDPEWLMGEKWRGVAVVSFEIDGKAFACEPFVLVPHDAL